MKLLLTSSGLTNSAIIKALKKLVKGPIRTAFIPTAANTVDENKDWLVKDITGFYKIGEIDIVDISAIPKKLWLPRLKKANVIAVGGGDTAHLINCMRKSGFDKEIRKLLKTRVYVGISAGSIATAKTIQASSDYIFQLYGDEAKIPPKGLGFVDFNIRPHFNSKFFPNVRDKVLKKALSGVKGRFYAIDDNTAVLYNDGQVSVVSKGRYKIYN